jgi:hypothetical protein
MVDGVTAMAVRGFAVVVVAVEAAWHPSRAKMASERTQAASEIRTQL